jgi:large-conductance mechanosensitive channel
LIDDIILVVNNFLQEKAMEATKQKEEKREKNHNDKPEQEQKGIMTIKDQHCPPEKRHGDRNPKYNEEQQ